VITDAALKRLERAYKQAPRIPGGPSVPVTVESDDLLSAIRFIHEAQDKLYRAEEIAKAIQLIYETATETRK
jgi:hypothetical protein